MMLSKVGKVSLGLEEAKISKVGKESPGLEEAKIVDLQIEKLIKCAKDVWHITSNATHSHDEKRRVQVNKFMYAQPDKIVQKFTKAVCAAYPTTEPPEDVTYTHKLGKETTTFD